MAPLPRALRYTIHGPLAREARLPLFPPPTLIRCRFTFYLVFGGCFDASAQPIRRRKNRTAPLGPSQAQGVVVVSWREPARTGMCAPELTWMYLQRVPPRDHYHAPTSGVPIWVNEVRLSRCVRRTNFRNRICEKTTRRVARRVVVGPQAPTARRNAGACSSSMSNAGRAPSFFSSGRTSFAKVFRLPRATFSGMPA